jgi:release factor glutamine methyltransferase
LSLALHLDPSSARLEAELLLCHALRVDRARLIADPALVLRADATPVYRDLFQRRLAGEPIAYLIGCREFYGRSFQVASSVLIPRPETELLVDLALARLPVGAPAEVLDVGTGSGCVAVTLARERPQATVVAVDVSDEALAVARANARAHAASKVELVRSDCYAALGGRRFDLIVSNPPYVAEGDPHLFEGDLRFEPAIALVGGADGLCVLRPLIAGAPTHLRGGGWLLVEHGFDQADAVRRLMRAAGCIEVFSDHDLAGLERVSGGLWRG